MATDLPSAFPCSTWTIQGFGWSTAAGLDLHTQMGMTPPVDLRKTIKDAMQRQDVTQNALESMTGILQHRISDYLTGKRDVNAETLQKMLEALNLEIRPARRRRKGR